MQVGGQPNDKGERWLQQRVDRCACFTRLVLYFGCFASHMLDATKNIPAVGRVKTLWGGGAESSVSRLTGDKDDAAEECADKHPRGDASEGLNGR